MSPDGESIVTGAGDETLRFWHVFPSAKNKGMEDNVLDGMQDLRWVDKFLSSVFLQIVKL